jgi:hypothetical protein
VDRLDVEEVDGFFEPGEGPVAPPTPVGRVFAVLRTDGIERDIAVRFHEMRILNDVLRGEPSDEEMPATVVLPVEPARVFA